MEEQRKQTEAVRAVRVEEAADRDSESSKKQEK